MNIVNFTPLESLLGGLIIGLAVAILYLMRGIIPALVEFILM
jgi:hypothetical protein